MRVPEGFNYIGAREMFMQPLVSDCAELDFSWNMPNEEVLKEFLIQGKAFAENRVESGIRRMKANLGKPMQQRLDSFFSRGPTKTSSKTPAKADVNTKRVKPSVRGRGKR
jgi:flap endonuclease-1